MKTKSNLSVRWIYLAIGVLTMLFAGVLYAWSILKVPFKDSFAWSDSSLALNFTLTMCTFCIGVVAGGLVYKKIGIRITLIASAIMVGAGFVLTGMLNADMLTMLYIAYAGLAGCGIGVCYNVVIATVNSWFPDRKGFCSGCLMMGFGLSTLLMGNTISAMFDNPAIGWKKAYIMLGIVMAIVIVIAALVLRAPTADVVFPAAKGGKKVYKEDFEVRDYTPVEMMKSFTFWRAFIYLTFVLAVGNSVISFARDLVLSVGAAPTLATTMVGVLSVFNGLGRILTGAIYDAKGRKFTMISTNLVAIAAAAICLLAVVSNSLPICVVGLCLAGLSYGSCPTVNSTFIPAFYGQKHFAVNFSIITANLIPASFIAAFSNNLFINTGSYTAPFVLLLVLAAGSLVLNLSIRRP